MHAFTPLRTLRAESGFKSNDVLVIFGEVFARGYVNGLIEEARKIGMKVVYSTVGRREADGTLRPLNADELATKDQPLVNVPLECGFDLETPPGGLSPVDQLKGLKLSEWNQAKLDAVQVAESRRRGRESFRARVKTYVTELEKIIPPDANVLFAHTMAGGIPRAKIIMPVINRVFKGYGDRFASSEEFWNGPLGRLCEQSFEDVTANTLDDLITLTAPLRERAAKAKREVGYVAYGYHGTEILMGNEYRWQSYSPYLQGFAKLALERIAVKAGAAGIGASVYNAPEILTNSSSIFLGVEVALYPLIGALKKEGKGHPLTAEIERECQKLLKPGHTIDEILKLTDAYFRSDVIQKWSDYPGWPQHNGPDQMERMRTTSEQIVEMHADEKHLLTARLSELVFRACGRAMLFEALRPRENVWWVGHDLVASSALNQAQSASAPGNDVRTL